MNGYGSGTINYYKVLGVEMGRGYFEITRCLMTRNQPGQQSNLKNCFVFTSYYIARFLHNEL